MHGLERAQQQITLAEDRRAALEELLPHGTPDDWAAVGSPALFDEYERKLHHRGHKLYPELEARPEEGPQVVPDARRGSRDTRRLPCAGRYRWAPHAARAAGRYGLDPASSSSKARSPLPLK